MEQRCFHNRGRPEALEHLDEDVDNGTLQRCQHSFDCELERITGSKRDAQGEEGGCEDQLQGFGQSRYMECGQGSFTIRELTKTGSLKWT